MERGVVGFAWRRARALAKRVLPDAAVGRARAWRQARHRARRARERERTRARERARREAQKAASHRAQSPSAAPRRVERTERERLYWSVNSLFQAVLGDGRVQVRMPPDDAHSLEVVDVATGFRAWLRVEPDGSTVLAEVESASGSRVLGEFARRHTASQTVLRALLEHERSAAGRVPAPPRRIWVPIVDGQPVPRMLDVGPQWTSALHRSGWAGAMETIASLHDERGATFDGFLEATFCWRDTGRVYRTPWVGVCHNPPETPAWLDSTNDVLFANPRLRRSLRHCRGLFVLSEHHRRSLAKRVDVPVSVIPLPSDTPPRAFSPRAFEENPRPRLVQIGHWLRNPNSLYQLPVTKLTKTRLDLGHPWEETARKHLPPTEPLDLASVEVLPRLSDDEYDELLARNIVFLDLLDSSANNALVECIVRDTPVLVNRIPAVVEHLGRQYPLYFDDLEQAARKAESPELVRRAHRYLRALPKERYTREGFLHAVVTSRVYRELEPPGDRRLLLLAPAGTDRALLRALCAVPGVRILEQPFHPERERWHGGDEHAYRHEAADADALDRCVDGILHLHAGLSHGLGQLPEHLEHLLLGRPAVRVLARRRDPLAAAILAVQDEAAGGPPSEAGDAAIPVAPEAVAARLDADARRLEETQHALRGRGLPFVEVEVEALQPGAAPWATRQATLRRILRKMDVEEPDPAAWARIEAALDEAADEEARRLAAVPDVAALRRRLGPQAAPRARGAALPFRDEAARVLLLHATHHKAGTHWILRVLRELARRYGLELLQMDDPFADPARADVLVDHQSTLDLSALPPFRGSHMIRDPRDMVVSGYFYHQWTHEAWVHEPDPRYDGRSYQEYLNAVGREEGLLEEVRRCAFTFESMAQWDYHDPRVFEIRYEDLMRDGEEVFRRLFAHYGLAPEAVEAGLDIARRNSFEARARRRPGEVQEGSVLRSGRPGQWREHFTPAVAARFREVTGDLLVRLGYEDGDAW